jgi:hypothetical protein
MSALTAAFAETGHGSPVPKIAPNADREVRQAAPVQHQRPQSSSASRCTAAQAGFFDLSQSGERPER